MWCVHWYKEHKGKRVLQWTRKHVVIFVAYLTFPRMNHGMFKGLSRRTSNFVYIYVLRAKLLPAEQFVGISLPPFYQHTFYSQSSSAHTRHTRGIDCHKLTLITIDNGITHNGSPQMLGANDAMEDFGIGKCMMWNKLISMQNTDAWGFRPVVYLIYRPRSCDHVPAYARVLFFVTKFGIKIQKAPNSLTGAVLLWILFVKWAELCNKL